MPIQPTSIDYTLAGNYILDRDPETSLTAGEARMKLIGLSDKQLLAGIRKRGMSIRADAIQVTAVDGTYVLSNYCTDLIHLICRLISKLNEEGIADLLRPDFVSHVNADLKQLGIGVMLGDTSQT